VIEMRKESLLIAQAIVVVVVIGDFFLKDNTLNYVATNITQWAVIIAGFTLVLGAATLGAYHVKHIINARRNSGSLAYTRCCS